MALVALTDCTLYKKLSGDFSEVLIMTPSTFDSNDTIDLSTLVTDTNVLGLFAWDVETGDVSTVTLVAATGVITVDAAGGTTNHTYCISVKFIGKPFTA